MKNEKNTSINNDKEINLYLGKTTELDPKKEAGYITAIYGIFGLLWIVLSDKLLYTMVQNITLYSEIQTYKGGIYVVMTMVLIYVLVKKRSTLFQKSLLKTKEAYEELQGTYEELLATEEDLLYQKDLTEGIIKGAPVVIGIWDEEGKIKRVNPFAEKVFGYTKEELYDKQWLDLLIAEEDKERMGNILTAIKGEKQLKNYETKFIAKNGQRIDLLWNSSLLNPDYSHACEVVSVGIDITERKKLEEKLKSAAYFDALTGLPNRTFLEVKVEQLIEEEIPFALIHMDFNNFKYINNTLGYAAGDQFLKYISDQLTSAIDQPNLVSRLISDEFGILLYGITEKNEVEALLKEMIEKLDRTWGMNNHEFLVSFSMGVALYPKDGSSMSILFRSADLAMMKAKKEGKGRVLFYVDEILDNSYEKIEIANQLHYAIERGELTLYYQPQFNLTTGKIQGLEALVRWMHSKRGGISPGKFIPLAEETGQIFSIEKWVINAALTQKKRFEEAGYEDLDISINLSSKTLMSEVNFLEIESLIASYNINHSQITIEITETAIIHQVDFAIGRLERLRNLGLKIALDDFGTGYSSLVYLNTLPIDIVKLDRSFIKSITNNSKEALIIKAILHLSRDLNYKVIAEGIETEGQFEFLKKYACEWGQGYLMSRPMPIEDVLEMLKKS